MIAKMTKYSIIMMSGVKDSFLKDIQDIGLLDITRSTKPIDGESTVLFDNAKALRRRIARIAGDDFTRDSLHNSLSSSLDDAQRELKARIPWGRFDAARVEELGRRGCVLHYYCVPQKSFDASWGDLYPLEVISSDNKSVYFVTVSDGGDYSFPVKECAAPAGPYTETEERIASLKGEIKSREQILGEEKKDIPQMEAEYGRTMEKLEQHLASCASEEAAEGCLTIFTAFAPTEDDASVKKALDGMDLYYMAEPATAADNPPVKLKNGWFARQFETLTGMYGMPVYDEFDPTPVLAPFFLLFWAFCLGDAGYGLLLIGVGFLLKKVDILGLKNHRRLVTTLGVGSTVIGLFLGTFFGINLAEVSWIPDSLKALMITGKLNLGGTEYDVAMVAAIAIGVFHICLAMVIKAIGLVHRFGFKASISTWGWIVLIVGGLIVAAGALTKVLDAEVTKWAVIVIGVISALGIFIFNKPGRNPLINIGAGLWDTYGMVTGILGDVLSYIRLYALGLAGGMLGNAFNNLAGMVTAGSANPTWQWLPFVLIVVLGHALNFAMSCLGAFVHPLRLTFVEYFKNSGFEGKGTAYNPLKKETIN